MLEINLADFMEFQARYWYEVDINLGRNATDFYLPDGRFDVGDQTWRGPVEIAQFYTSRQENGPRTARHVVSNFIQLEADIFQCILTLTAVDGLPPLPAELPVQIADIRAELQRESDGTIRFVRHSLTPIFVGKEIPALKKRDAGYTFSAGSV